jgi:DNA-binding winged helix-turn-helix (wHTH) protein
MTIHALGPFRLDSQNSVLLRGTEPVALGRRAVALLRALVERPGVLMSREALFEAVWPGLAVEDGNLTAQIAALRRALSEAPGGDHWIETMPRRGYRFIGPVVENEENSVTPAPPRVGIQPETAPLEDNATTAPAAIAGRVGAYRELPHGDGQVPAAPLTLPDKPSIAVLPFQNMSGDPEQEYFADGMVEEITTATTSGRIVSTAHLTTFFNYRMRWHRALSAQSNPNCVRLKSNARRVSRLQASKRMISTCARWLKLTNIQKSRLAAQSRFSGALLYAIPLMPRPPRGLVRAS